ncbi:predicted protein [Lichtheimia corymbifera JMRC:FSU:9682]|uniref:Uncharacterized protein n=1 Tax=Lichtheimia corymbifera JMRC:FSU:9682 TaxID=1263082 RepID=A0A068SAW4_9FUNG|nr:predicted protein [Lichtheimia corymbifera JMRC:FSU:9682]
MATKKSLTKPRFRTSYQKTDKRNCKTADQVILEWFQSHGNVTRAFSNGSLGLVQFRYTKEIWLAVNKQSSPLRTLGSVRSRIHRWLRDLQQARMMAKEGSSKRAIKKIFPYYYDLTDHINHQPHRQGKKGVMISSSANDLHEAVTEQEALVPCLLSSSSKDRDTRVPSYPISRRQPSPSSLPPPPPQIIIPYKPMPAIMTASDDSNDDDEDNEQKDEEDEEEEEEEEQEEEKEYNDNTQLDDDDDDRMKMEMIQLLQKNYDYILSVSRIQEMERKAALIRTMHDAGFSKDEIVSMLNTI